MAGKDLLSRLADAGEEAISRLGKVPGSEQVAGAMHALRDRTDELQKRVMGVEELENRIAELEQRLAALEGAKRSPARQTAAKTGRAPATRTSSRSSAAKTTRKSASASSGSKAKPTRSSSSGGSSAPTGGDSPG